MSSRETKSLIEFLGVLYLGLGIYATVKGLKSASEAAERQKALQADIRAIRAAIVTPKGLRSGQA